MLPVIQSQSLCESEVKPIRKREKGHSIFGTIAKRVRGIPGEQPEDRQRGILIPLSVPSDLIFAL